MGNPLSKCCAEDTTVPRKKITITRTTKTSNGVKTTTTASSSTGASSTAASKSEPVASYVPPKDDASTKDNASLFQRISASLASITDTIGGSPSRSIEQGLKDISYSLTEEERKVLLANEIPASEIKKLSIGVDAGGMGIIHIAEYKGIKVAIKEASVHVISKEVDIYSRMKGSEGVVQFYGVTFPPGLDKICIVTKYADSGSLTWHLKVAYHQLTWADKLRLATQIVTGIQRLHQEGIYHRDLHGGNILIDNEGNAMLTDFGASTVMEERMTRNMTHYDILAEQVTETNSKFISKQITGLEQQSSKFGQSSKDNNVVTNDPLIGVMAYIAPERFRNPSYFDAKCDIYSLGVLLWELTTGHSAFARVPQDVHLAVAIMNGKRELGVEGTPADYKALYERCWSSDPAARPSIDEILKTLAQVKDSMTLKELRETRKRVNVSYESVTVYEESVSVSVHRPTSEIQQHFLSQ
ncbi:hypothetical protein BG006_000424 [Podila minutissima]|uniref:Protein kinase domain-containing protein n=1 Tax=Podila minutissima TaxID=64525 RepID=A0A9P5VPE7_9FUNG|nr:hypothetical protein BG006_000424 [Podila minutissima]